MATFQELLKQLQKKAVRVFLLDKHYEVNKKDYYQAIRYYWVDENGILRSEAVIIHVLVKDDGTEEAYWKDRVPTILATSTTSPTSFADEVEEYAKKNVSNFVGLNPIAVNDAKKRGLFEVFIYNPSTDQVEKKTVYVWKNKEGQLMYKVVKQS
ncbi:MAG: hypothetical protein DRH17_12540 [Deltaproteobacteria bacterium]|nr:MAG: hypothetical protein DRH17_12540 [Deltaproteobacteria bacterium]